MNVIFYAHGGSYNHGCEAIIRGTINVLGDHRYTLYSMRKHEDAENGLDKLVQIEDDVTEINKLTLHYFIYCLKYKLTHDDTLFYREQHRNLYRNCSSGSIAFSVGGDNYCYDGLPERMAEYNEGFVRKGLKTVLWGCSIEPELLKNDKIRSDLKKYSLIVSRESITFNALRENGINQSVLFPDPAFALEKDDSVMLPDAFGSKGVVGINASPLVEGIAGDIVFQNYCRLIEHILANTEMDILLVPHVVWPDLDDRNSLKKIREYFKNNSRIYLVPDVNCQKLKGYIGKCTYFIGARTHSTIAAYSQKIPTLVVGYSVKSKGIARDLFGTCENYVVSVQDMKNDMQLVDAFSWIVTNRENIIGILNERIPSYISRLGELRKMIEELNSKNEYKEE